MYWIDIFLKILSVPVFFFGAFTFLVALFANSVKIAGVQVHGKFRMKMKAEAVLIGAVILLISFCLWNFFEL